MLRTEVIDCPLTGMGEALLRMAERNGKGTVSDEDRLTMSVIMKGIELSETEGSVCICAEELERLFTVPESSEGPADEAEYVPAATEAAIDESRPAAVADPEAHDRLKEGFVRLADKGLLSAYPREEGDAPVTPLVLDKTSDADNPRLYVARYFAEECALAVKLLAMGGRQEGESNLSPAMHETIRKLSQALNPETKNELQEKAVEKALTRRLTVISGGPGTGKTTTVGLILECLLTAMKEGDGLLDETEEPLRVFLAAPTGKATGRMRQSIQNLTTDEWLKKAFLHLGPANRGVAGARAVIESRTIHKWLATRTSSGSKPSAENPLEADVLIIDEASMIDVHLAAKLFDAIAEKTRVIILGDKYQLAAVGPGAVFADISRAVGGLADATVKLEVSRRFAEGSPIAEIAHAINHDGNKTDEEAMGTIVKLLKPMKLKERAKLVGKTEAEELESIRLRTEAEADIEVKPGSKKVYAVAAYPDEPSFLGFSETARVWIDAHTSLYCDALVAYLREMTQENLKRVWTVLMNFRPLCAQRHGPQSVAALNAYMIQQVKARLVEEGLDDGETVGSSWPGAVVIVRQNDDMLGVYNGDVGVVLPVMKEGEKRLMTIFGDSGLEEGEGLRIPPSLLPRHDSAFAMTIHQSQGSEFRHVAVFLPMKDDSPLATRELLYTGVTRTKESVTIFGRTSVLEKAVATATTRVSGLAARLDA